jgi:hypothetical protein
MPTETFDPLSRGLTLQRPFDLEPFYNVEEDTRELGNKKTVAITERSPRTWSLNLQAYTMAQAGYVRSFFNRLIGPAGRFLFELPELVEDPDTGPALTAAISGSQAQRTIHVVTGWRNSYGETLPSPRVSLLVPLNNLLVVDFLGADLRYPAGAEEAIIYATQGAAGTECQQTILGGELTWMQPNAPLLTGTQVPPTANTAKDKPLCKLVKGTLKFRRGIGVTYEIALDIEEDY